MCSSDLRKRGKKILVPNSVHTRPELENPKKNSKKMKKIKKSLSGIIFKNGSRKDKKEGKKKFVPISVHTWPGEENSEKNSKKIRKIKKPHSYIIFSQNGLR